MAADKSDPVVALSNRLSDLYVVLEDLTEEGSLENLFKVLALLQDVRMAIGVFDQFAFGVLKRHDVSWSEIVASLGGTREDLLQRFRLVEGESGAAGQCPAARLAASDSLNKASLIKGNVYTRSELRKVFEIHNATLNNGVFHFKERREVWLFVTENKQADREQYVDKLVGSCLYWQGQRMGRTDSLIIDHKRTGEKLLLFYRRAKYEFEGAGFRYEGIFEYVNHSGSCPTSFVLRRVDSLGLAIRVTAVRLPEPVRASVVGNVPQGSKLLASLVTSSTIATNPGRSGVCAVHRGLSSIWPTVRCCRSTVSRSPALTPGLRSV
jgi:hypothetical protein